MPDEDFAASVGMGSVHVILKGRGEEAWAEYSQP
jgi:hypothetical protein